MSTRSCTACGACCSRPATTDSPGIRDSNREEGARVLVVAYGPEADTATDTASDLTWLEFLASAFVGKSANRGRMEIRGLTPNDTALLADFFSVIASDEEASIYFHPHPFDVEAARTICDRRDPNGDEYFAAFDGDRMVGYGMARGWAEGYDVPSFGVYVHPEERGRGIAASLLSWAIERAKDRGAPSIVLKVYPENARAVRFYKTRGFEFSGETMDTQLVGRLRLD